MTSVPRLAMKRNDTRKYTAWSWTKGYAAWLVLLPLYLSLWAFATVFKKLPDWATRKLLLAHDRYTGTHEMDFRIPPNNDVPAYMHRWWRIARNAYFNIYYHIVLRGDDDRALHDHPWFNFSIVLDGGYWEHTINEGGVHSKIWYGPGSVRFRRAGTFAHRLELATNGGNMSVVGAPKELPVKTIFITGPVLRRWGFHHPDQWVDAYDWDSFLAARNERNLMPMGAGSDGAISTRNKI
jgi:hypothetical protein